MKTLSIIIAIVVIIGGVVFFMNKDKDDDLRMGDYDDVMMEEGEAEMMEEQGSIMEGDNSVTSEETFFEVTGKNFSFDVKEIRVKEGDIVTINFEAESGFHDWVVDEFNAKTEQVQSGTKTSVTFVADKTGTFEYYCSVGSHRQNGMVGKLIVE